MTNERDPSPQGGWLHLKAAARYVDLSVSALSLKLSNGNGPRFHQSPGSRFKIFSMRDLDDWVMNAPERQLTHAEQGRLAKLQEGAARVREERRARRRAEISEDVTA
jgi:hypothetical protein